MKGLLPKRCADWLSCNAAAVLLSLIWILGLFFGVQIAAHAGEDVLSLMRTAPRAGVSIVGRFAVLLVPFLLSALAAFLQWRWLLFLICFFKAYFFAFVSGAVALAFGSAGFLVCPLLLFSDICLLPLLFWFCLRLLRADRRTIWRSALPCAACAVVLGCLDCFVISPFLRAVFCG